MNHDIHRLVWREASRAYVAVPENAAGRGLPAGTRGARRRALAAALALAAAQAAAAPQGGVVAAGTGSIATAGSTTTVQQGSERLVVNWQSFGIAAGETVRFDQPSATAVALNRVQGQDPSVLLGQLQANGRVFLLNPNGILFGASAQVEVGGLVASTLGMADADFLADRWVLSGTGGSVRNDGLLRATGGGSIALVGGEVRNTGTIEATQGSVLLAAGSRVSFDMFDGRLTLSVDQGVAGALVANGGIAQADGGRVILTARGRDALAAGAVNNTGLVQARSLANIGGGRIELRAEGPGDSLTVDGTLDASAPGGGDAGTIDTVGSRVQVAPTAALLLDAPAGGAGAWRLQTSQLTLDAALHARVLGLLDAGADVTTSAVSTDGSGSGNSLVFAAPLAWSGSGNWTIESDRDIGFQGAVTAPLGGLSLQAGGTVAPPPSVLVDRFSFAGGDWRQVGPGLAPFSARSFAVTGGSFLRAGGGSGTAGDPYRVVDLYGLQGIGSGSNTLAQHWALAGDLDATAAAAWNDGAGFRAIGQRWDPFAGSFDGRGHVVRNLVVNAGFEDAGLFSALGPTGEVRNVGVQGSIQGGLGAAGGVVGYNEGLVRHVWSDATVAGGSAGGVVGDNAGGTVTDSHARGNVSGGSAGGFAGSNSGTIRRAWASGAVDGGGQTGGFVGYNAAGGVVDTAYATGAVQARFQEIGGFVGRNEGAIRRAYATGAVTGLTVSGDPLRGQYTGGFVGFLADGTLSQVYATGRVSAPGMPHVGGLGGGRFGGTVENAFWVQASTGQSRGFPINAGTRITTTALAMRQASYQTQAASLDFANDWVLYADSTTPLLRAFLTPLTVTANDVTRTYDGSSWSGGAGLSSAVPVDPALLLGTPVWGGTAQGARDAGQYTLTASGLWSTQQGYLISYAPGRLTIDPKALDVTGVAGIDKVYDGTRTATLDMASAALAGVVGADDVRLATGSAAGLFADRHVGSGKSVQVSGLALEGAAATNYVLTAPSGVRAGITPAGVTVAARPDRRGYDGTTASRETPTVSGVLAGDTVAAAATQRFDTRHAGSGKTLIAGGLVIDDGNGGANYTVTYLASTAGEITPAPVTVTALPDQRVYDGTTGSAVTPRVDGLLAGDALVSASQRFDSRNVGQGKTLTPFGLVVDDGNGGGNYTVTWRSAALGSITPAPLTVRADDARKPEGEPDPLLGFRALGLLGGDTPAVALAGALQRDPGEAPSTYAIRLGSLAAVHGNYAITYVPGQFTIDAVVRPQGQGGGQPPPVAAGDGPGARSSTVAAWTPPVPESTRSVPCQARTAPAEPSAPACGIGPALAVRDGGVRLP